MFGLAYVILPFSDTPPGEAITRSMARFRMGRRGDVPDAWLRFHDETASLRECYERCFTFTRGEGLAMADGPDMYLRLGAITATMEKRGLQRWTVRLADIEPDFAAFVERFAAVSYERHPVTGGFGRWLNGLGQWDWWELGGRYNGKITGHEREAYAARTAINSGYSAGREAFEKLAGALADVIDGEPLAEVDIVTDDNIELVSTLSRALDQGLS